MGLQVLLQLHQNEDSQELGVSRLLLALICCCFQCLLHANAVGTQ